MNNRQARTLDMYELIVQNLGADGTKLAAEAAPILERLRQTIAEIRRYAREQEDFVRGHSLTIARRSLDQMRNDQMLPLARLARRVFIGESRIQEALRVPHKRAPSEEILAAAARMVAVLRPHRALLTGAHINTARIANLHRATIALGKEFKAAKTVVADRAAPTRRLPALFASARLDALALDALAGSREFGREIPTWKDMRRIHKRIGRPPVRSKRAVQRAAAP